MPIVKERTRLAFGLFEADLSSGELWKAGRRIRLQSQPFKILAALLEHPGEIVTRADLQRRLWGEDTVVGFEHSLGTAVNRIRDALGDSASNPRFIETLNRRGYRFIAPVSDVSIANSSAESETSLFNSTLVDSFPGDVSGQHRWTTARGLFWAMFLLNLLLIGAGLAFVRFRYSATSQGPMRVSEITDSGDLYPGGLSVENLPTAVTDGIEVFARVMQNGQALPARIAINGGDVQTLQIPSSIRSPSIADISPDHSELLVRSQVTSDSEQPLWVVPVHGGSAFRLGNIVAHDATWMPDGQSVLYATGNQLWVIRLQDGSSILFATIPAGRPFWLRWSPDGLTLRFTTLDPTTHGSSLWQMTTKDRLPIELLKGWNSPAHECCGTWTADGKYYVFQATRHGGTDLWLLPNASTSGPIRLTNGPLSYRAPVADDVGHRIFFLGVDPATQLFRYDPVSRGFRAGPNFLARAQHLDYSRDGQWVAWTDSHGQLWRSRADGSERLQLTPRFLKVFLGSWSPDGKRLAIMASQAGKPWQIYMVGADGGKPQLLFQDSRNAADPSWSPDGEHLVYGRLDNNMGREIDARMLYILDLRTGRSEPIPHSEGVFSPRWSPDGNYIAAITLDQEKLMLYDVKSGAWKMLANTSASDPVWSRDSEALYFHALTEEYKPLYRVSIRGDRLDQVATLQSFRSEAPQDYSFCGLGPDDSPFVRLSIHSTDLYSANLDTR